MTAWLAETAFAATLLMLVVLALRGPVARLFGAGWAYALWAIPALRLVLPPLPLFHPDIALPPAMLFIPATAAGVTAPLPAEAGPGQWVPFLLATWAGGAVIFLILQWLSYRLFLTRLAASSRPARPPSYGGIATLVSEIVDGPLALGLLRRRIVIPADFSRRYGPVERRMAMEHELVHHRRCDIWCNAAAILILALNWFNPVAWIAYRAFRSDQELACDAAVAAAASPEERHDYARALVKSATAPGLIAACPFHDAGQLKRRLRMMRSHRRSRLRSAGGIAAVGALALAGFAVGGAAPAEKQPAALAHNRLRAAPVLAQAAPIPAPAPVVHRRAVKPKRARAVPPPRDKAAAYAALDKVVPQLGSLALDPSPAEAVPMAEARAPRVIRFARLRMRGDGLDPERRARLLAAVSAAFADAGEGGSATAADFTAALQRRLGAETITIQTIETIERRDGT